MTQPKHPLAHRPQRTKKGFTLVEVIIAGAIFSFLLIVAIGAIMNALSIYTAANISRDNQQSVRTITEDIARRAQFANDMAVDSANRLCIRSTTGKTQIYYATIGGPLMRTETEANGNTCEQILAGSVAAGQQISSSGIVIKLWEPKIVKNDAAGGGDTQNALSVDLQMTVARSELSLVGPGAPVRLKNEFSIHTAFFALNF